VFINPPSGVVLMKKNLFAYVVFVLLIVSSGCSKTPVMADRVLVNNASEWKVTEVKVRHLPTNKIGAVSAILPKESLDIGFPKQPLLADRAIVRWIDGQGQNRSDELDIPYDSVAAKAKKAMSLIYIIHPSGSVSALLQDSMLMD
jgi:hypothetical protein